MAFGKSLDKPAPRKFRVWQPPINKETGKMEPLRRSVPKIKASKKQRRKARELENALKMQAIKDVVSKAHDGNA